MYINKFIFLSPTFHYFITSFLAGSYCSHGISLALCFHTYYSSVCKSLNYNCNRDWISGGKLSRSQIEAHTRNLTWFYNISVLVIKWITTDIKWIHNHRANTMFISGNPLFQTGVLPETGKKHQKSSCHHGMVQLIVKISWLPNSWNAVIWPWRVAIHFRIGRSALQVEHTHSGPVILLTAH